MRGYSPQRAQRKERKKERKSKNDGKSLRKEMVG
jgi:hypothetical protein